MTFVGFSADLLCMNQLEIYYFVANIIQSHVDLIAILDVSLPEVQ